MHCDDSILRGLKKAGYLEVELDIFFLYLFSGRMVEKLFNKNLKKK